ncbi:MAG: hypothetical protein QM536_07535 [Chitinophagaceae bacterium]|nr:hypothetical protein [Chitinophagaceae bacterium]
MKVVLVNFSTKVFDESRKCLNVSAIKFGIEPNCIFSFGEEDLIGTDFYKQHLDIFQNTKGFGYWLWKPFFISEVFRKLSPDDVLLYMDAGIECIDSLHPLISLCQKNDIICFGNGNNFNAEWTKMDCFVRMNTNTSKIKNAIHCDGSIILFKKTEFSELFIIKWLSYCSEKPLISDDTNIYIKKNSIFFKEHRHDQSIFSILAHQYNVPIYRCPSQFGNHYKHPRIRVSGEFNCISQVYQKQVKFYAVKYYNNSLYPQILNHHRRKNNPSSVLPVKKHKNKKEYFLYKLQKPWRLLVSLLRIMVIKQLQY